MSPERHEQVKRLFLAACTLDDTSRSAFLDQACSGDAELRAEIESLLKHHDPATIIEASSGERRGEAVAEAGRALARGMESASVGSTAPDEGRFLTGALFAHRYRIVSLLGRGGMGEVYRAEDVKLNRPVALKFLTHGRGNDPAWLSRFYNEARISLSVTHRSVCRIHDLGESGGEVYISMEYVDGEDLASLLRRIGRLPCDKAVHITRQLCYGLSAAHAQGVLHRDLKPANIMIDGRGEVRITDFGIAVLLEPRGKDTDVAGTPGYMAPEVLSGSPPSLRSDIYSLGAVMYEMVTGRRAFEGATLTGRPGGQKLIPPSELFESIDPVLEGLILRCLSDVPEDRPASVMDVVKALPGADPLAAALAAGETPSPEIIAAARTETNLRPVRMIAWACAAVVGLVAVFLLADHTLLLSRLGLGKSPDVLEDRADQVLRTLGAAPSGGRPSCGFVIDPSGLDSLRRMRADAPSARWTGEHRPAVLFFDYYLRTGAERPVDPLEEPQRFDLRYSTTAESFVRLDALGRLCEYWGVSNTPVGSDRRPAEPDWKTAFDLAGLDFASFTTTAPKYRPRVYADTHLAWQGVHPHDDSVPLHVEAASADGSIVYLRVALPSAPGPSSGNATLLNEAAQPMSRKVVGTFFFITLLGGLPLAWRNLRSGRGDRRGAGRVAALMFVVQLLLWLVRYHHVADLVIELSSLVVALRIAVFGAVMVWIYYVALEPYVRRFWPQSIISWSRLLSGQTTDPLIGRDVLVGTALGVAIVILQQVNVLVSSRTGGLPLIPAISHVDFDLGRLVGFLHCVDTVAHAILGGIGRGMIALMLMLLLRVVLRTSWLAGLAFVAIIALAYMLSSEYGRGITLVSSLILSAAVLAVLVHAGLLAAIVAIFVSQMMLSNPMTCDLQVWYSASTGFLLVILMALVAFGSYATLRRRPGTV